MSNSGDMDMRRPHDPAAMASTVVVRMAHLAVSHVIARPSRHAADATAEPASIRQELQPLRSPPNQPSLHVYGLPPAFERFYLGLGGDLAIEAPARWPPGGHESVTSRRLVV
jgi:hypothetical protein